MSNIVSDKDLEKGSIYLLIEGERYIAGELIGFDYRYSFTRKKKIVNGVQSVELEKKDKQYLSVVLKGVDEMGMEKGVSITKMFEMTGSDQQIYFTNGVLFSDCLIKIDSYEWMRSKMLSLNKFKLDRRNAYIASKIACSMIFKENPGLKIKSKNKVTEFMLKEASLMSDQIESELISVFDFHNNQLPEF